MKARPKVTVTAEPYGGVNGPVFYEWTFYCAECNEAGYADKWEHSMDMAWGHICFGHTWEPCS